LEYGISFFKTSLESIYKEKNDLTKSIAIAFRVGRYAKDDEFREFISEVKEEVVEVDELICF